MLALFAISFAVQFICISSINDLPSYFPRCAIDDPDINACILKASSDLREHVKKGIPEVDMPSFDPLVLPEIRLEQGTSAVNYKMVLTNVSIHGLGDYKFTEFTYDPKTLSFHGRALFKSMTLQSKYVADGKILLVPIQGKGNVKLDLGNSVGILDIHGELVERKGEKYYNPKDVKTKIEVNDFDSSFDGLFDGNEQLAQVTNTLLKEHSRELIVEVQPAVEEVIKSLVQNLVLGVTKRVPYNKLFIHPH